MVLKYMLERLVSWWPVLFVHLLEMSLVSP